MKKATRKQRCFKKRWLTKALLKSIKTKNKLYKKYLQVPTVDNSSLYKTYKNKLNHTLCLAKRWYYEKKLEDAKSNTHATWKILNEDYPRFLPLVAPQGAILRAQLWARSLDGCLVRAEDGVALEVSNKPLNT